MRLVATIVCAVACLALVWAERTHHKARFVAKPIASAAFIVAGLGAPPLVVAGLVLGALGDVALLFEKGFLAGLAVFLLGHLAYAVAFPPTQPLWIVAPAVGGLVARTAKAKAAGVFGVPTWVVDEKYLFWGQDRLELVARALAGWEPKQ